MEKEQIKQTKKIIRMEIKKEWNFLTSENMEEKYPLTVKWIKQCHNLPSIDGIKMSMINDFLHGFGVEAIRGMHIDNYYFDCVAEYVNVGEMYFDTVILDHVKGIYRFMSLGDFIEKFEKRYEIN